MQRPDESGRPVKGRRRSTIRSKACKAPSIAQSNTELQDQLEQRTRERDETLEQQAATSEVLRVIRRSPTDVQPVFDMIAESAAKLCAAEFCFVYRFDGQLLHFVAHHSVAPEVLEINRRAYPQAPSRNSVAARAILEKIVVQIPDVHADADYALGELAAVCGYRSAIGIPILRDGLPVGSIAIARAQIGLFPERQIELLKTFADQAVIAIENVRLFNETREALEQQTATSEVLSVISSSAGQLDPVFGTMLAKATELCGASYGTLWLHEGDGFRMAAMHGGLPPAWMEQWRSGALYRPGRDVGLGRAAEGRQPIQVADMRTDPSYIRGDPLPVAAVEIAGIRTLLVVPMLKESELVGAIAIYRKEVLPFTEKQIELVKNFSAQAVIAIENARLLNELRQRTHALSESLEQQTATSEVLKVIGSSASHLQTVFDAMAENAVRLCQAERAYIFRFDGKLLRAVASYNVGPENWKFVHSNPIAPGRHSISGRAALERRTVQVADIQADPEFAYAIRDVEPIRTVLSVPMLKGDDLVGTITIYRIEVKPFTDKQVALVETFADQAVIAVENTRLLSELRESLQQQTATADVLKVISRSTFELQVVLDTLVGSAARLCEAENAFIYLRDGDVYRVVANHGFSREFEEFIKQHPLLPDRGTCTGRTALEAKMVHIPDVLVDPEYTLTEAIKLGKFRTMLGIPLLREGDPIGVMVLTRTTVQPFSDKQIDLVTTFADQAVIAIENVRLFDEVQARTQELSESLEQQTATSEVLKVISSSPGELGPVFDAMLANAVHICGASFGGLYRLDDGAWRAAALFGVPPAFAKFWQRGPQRPDPRTALGRVAETKQSVHIADITTEPAYIENDPVFVAAVKRGGFRTILAVPMLKEHELVGTIAIYRTEVNPFTEKQIELLTNFASQAVIAIENTRLLSELRESLQQQTATADVLKVISRSTFDLQVVLDTLVESAVRLCEAERGLVFRREGEIYKSVAYYNYSPEFRAFHESHPIKPGRGTAVGRTALEGKAVQIVDVLADPEYTFGEAQKLGGGRATLGVPLLREGTPIGALALQRTEPRPYSQKQIELVETFADQAVIAIENARLFDEVQARTRDLTDSLQQQTATADVLKIISRSAFDLPTVLDALIETAARMADAEQGSITREIDGEFFRAASYGYSSALSEFIRNTPVQMNRSSIAGRALVEGRIVQIPDIRADPEYTFLPGLDSGDFRTALGIPMLREGVTIGALALTRKEVRLFTDKQIELATTFADQAAIAIENVRLFKSVEARTRELAKSLEDLRTTQDRLVQTQKLASLGQLTAGIAHEIKNPLNFVNNFSGISAELITELQEALADERLNEKRRDEINELMDTLRGNLDKIVQHGKRADAIVKNMLLHSREGSGEHRVVDINALVEESLNLAYHGARAEKQGFNITLQRSFDPAAGQADVFPQDVTRVLLNLISNGFYAATKRKARADGNGYEPTLVASTRSLGDRVEIRVRDNGTGIPPEVKEKMFNPFFTTKPAGEGTGLGLSICHDIVVKQHGGSIEVETQPGEFTEIRVTLPRVSAVLS
jgi:GAF domain-containing protein